MDDFVLEAKWTSYLAYILSHDLMHDYVSEVIENFVFLQPMATPQRHYYYCCNICKNFLNLLNSLNLAFFCFAHYDTILANIHANSRLNDNHKKHQFTQ